MQACNVRTIFRPDRLWDKKLERLMVDRCSEMYDTPDTLKWKVSAETMSRNLLDYAS